MTTNEVTLNDLNTADTIFLETRHSTYQFTVTDAVARAGILSGGLLHEAQIAANFLCSVSSREGASDDTQRLKVGSRAIFIYPSEAGTRYVVTSVITNLIYQPHEQNEKKFTAPDSFCALPSH